ncbi:hypothetical protein GCWU000341_01953 [Oribacterium sp. oral taxon 078 str. F0262]|nr:hypothetical protein GCWU000341_01953 [Oribacterium sp. oral taxon 078 str. F0262]
MIPHAFLTISVSICDTRDILMIPHAFAASQLSPCAPPFALPRRFAPLPAHVGACLKLTPPLLCEHKSEERAYTLESYSI